MPAMILAMSAIGASGGLLEAQAHLASLTEALAELERELPRLESWGRHLATVLINGGRLLAAGNGGSAAQAEHLAAELLGRYREDRRPLAALALTAEGAAITAIGNDYAFEEIFARQVTAYGRPGDVLIALSTSGRSPDVLAAVAAAHAAGVTVWALTGPLPNPLADTSDDALAVPAPTVANVQEVHQVAIHLLCGALDRALAPA
jgi:D-sedoheptulose 7-phosphate isomerase